MDSAEIYQLVTHLPNETKVSIESKDGRIASVIIDNMDFSKASEIVYRHKAGQESELTVKFVVGEMKLDSICEVKIKNWRLYHRHDTTANRLHYCTDFKRGHFVPLPQTEQECSK